MTVRFSGFKKKKKKIVLNFLVKNIFFLVNLFAGINSRNERCFHNVNFCAYPSIKLPSILQGNV